jgi:hypothetical protein
MVSHWIKGERLVLVKGKVDVQRSDALLMTSLDPRRGGANGGPALWADAIRAASLTDAQIERLTRAAVTAAVLAIIREIATIAGAPAERQ